jgi:hypothetical protein
MKVDRWGKQHSSAFGPSLMTKRDTEFFEKQNVKGCTERRPTRNTKSRYLSSDTWSNWSSRTGGTISHCDCRNIKAINGVG